MGRVAIDMIGRRFGKFFVLSRAKNDKNRNACFCCLCDCGNTKTICGKYLRNGKSSSCGCKRTETRPLPAEAYLLKATSRRSLFLSSGYVRDVLVRRSTLSRGDIPQNMVEKKRQQLEVFRGLKELHKTISELQNA